MAYMPYFRYGEDANYWNHLVPDFMISGILSFLFLLSLIGLVVGLIKPSIFAKLLNLPSSRRQMALIFGSSALVLMVLAGITAPKTSSPTQEATKAVAETKQIDPIKVQTASFIGEFDKNQLAAEEKYKGKLVEFSAVIGNISEDIGGGAFLSLKPSSDQYYFGTNIKCSFQNKSDLTSLENGQNITVRGTVKEQSLGIIILDKCQVVK